MSRMMKMLLTGALLLALTAGAAVAQGALATVDCTETTGPQKVKCIGSNGNDDITGTSEEGNGFRDVILALRGQDFADAGEGNDEVHGQGGNDCGIFEADREDPFFDEDENVDDCPEGVGGLIGGTGDDLVAGGIGDDDLDDSDGGEDKDTLKGGDGDDVLDAQDGDTLDILDCGRNRDIAFFDPGDTVRNCEERFVPTSTSDASQSEGERPAQSAG